jgi:hypothetical protein
MTNPDDYWRHQTSAAPHAPPHDPQIPGLPLDQGQPAVNIGGSENFQMPTATGNVGGWNPFLTLANAFIVCLFCVPIFGSLYPMATGAAVATYFAVDRALRAVILDDSSRLPFVGVAALVVFWFTSRFDHRLAATFAPYRYARHVARVLLVATFITMQTISVNGRGGWMPRSAFEVEVLVTDHRFLPVMAVAAVIAHLFLTRATGLRERWDRSLEFLRLRPRSLA